MSKNKTVTVIAAIVDTLGKGINIRAKNDQGELEGYFVPAEAWGRIPKGKDPYKELSIIANLLSGLKESEDGNWVPIEDFIPKKITIETES